MSQDILGQAISDYYNYQRDQILWVHDRFGPKVDMPIATYFRSEAKMPPLELAALDLCRGSVLDIGSGAGSHALALEDRKIKVTAMDISPLAIEVATLRGVTKAIAQDIFSFSGKKFDTLLLLMNGIGLCGNMEGLRRFLAQAKKLLKPGGQLIFDSSDVAYLFEDDMPVLDHYYGEIECRYEYKKQKSEWFSWLYIDRDTLQLVAHDEGWRMELITEDESGQYLVRLTRA